MKSCPKQKSFAFQKKKKKTPSMLLSLALKCFPNAADAQFATVSIYKVDSHGSVQVNPAMSRKHRRPQRRGGNDGRRRRKKLRRKPSTALFLISFALFPCFVQYRISSGVTVAP